MTGRAIPLGSRKLLKFEVISIQHPLQGVTKQKRILAIVESQAHSVEADMRMKN
jgi:hypothetical protein